MQAVIQSPWHSLEEAARQNFGTWGHHFFPTDAPRPWRQNDAAMQLHDCGAGLYLGAGLENVIIAPSKEDLRQCWDHHIDRELSDSEIADLGCGWVIFSEQIGLAQEILREGLASQGTKSCLDDREAA